MEKTRNLCRDINLDLIRCVAIFSVISVHFFLNNEFYTTTIQGKRLYIAVFMRTAFMICVPMFLILTGYLMNSKHLTKKYYIGIKKTLIIYLLSTLCILIYKIAVMKTDISIFDAFVNITSFQQYSWYVEMYIGLFLLIPFLNLIYKNLPDKKSKIMLLITLMLLTTLPSIVNNFDFITTNWIFQPSISSEYQKFVPSWWTSIYPLTYYFIGAFINEYRKEINISIKVNFVLIVLSLFASSTYSYWRSYGSVFVSGEWCAWGGFENLINSILIFVFLLRISTDCMPKAVKKIIVTISEVSFGMYIVSWIFDQYTYPKLISSVSNMPSRIQYYFIVVPFIFICTFILAYIINLVYKIVNVKKISRNKH